MKHIIKVEEILKRNYVDSWLVWF